MYIAGSMVKYQWFSFQYFNHSSVSKYMYLSLSTHIKSAALKVCVIRITVPVIKNDQTIEIDFAVPNHRKSIIRADIYMVTCSRKLG